jgi:hypothetical protein
MIRCERHGEAERAFVCGHLLHGTGRGFHSDPADRSPCPDAWCSECELIRLEHGGAWNEESEASIDVRLVCSECYLEIRASNMPLGLLPSS